MKKAIVLIFCLIALFVVGCSGLGGTQDNLVGLAIGSSPAHLNTFGIKFVDSNNNPIEGISVTVVDRVRPIRTTDRQGEIRHQTNARQFSIMFEGNEQFYGKNVSISQLYTVVTLKERYLVHLDCENCSEKIINFLKKEHNFTVFNQESVISIHNSYNLKKEDVLSLHTDGSEDYLRIIIERDENVIEDFTSGIPYIIMDLPVEQGTYTIKLYECRGYSSIWKAIAPLTLYNYDIFGIDLKSSKMYCQENCEREAQIIQQIEESCSFKISESSYIIEKNQNNCFDQAFSAFSCSPNDDVFQNLVDELSLSSQLNNQIDSFCLMETVAQNLDEFLVPGCYGKNNPADNNFYCFTIEQDKVHWQHVKELPESLDSRNPLCEQQQQWLNNCRVPVWEANGRHYQPYLIWSIQKLNFEKRSLYGNVPLSHVIYDELMIDYNKILSLSEFSVGVQDSNGHWIGKSVGECGKEGHHLFNQRYSEREALFEHYTPQVINKIETRILEAKANLVASGLAMWSDVPQSVQVSGVRVRANRPDFHFKKDYFNSLELSGRRIDVENLLLLTRLDYAIGNSDGTGNIQNAYLGAKDYYNFKEIEFSPRNFKTTIDGDYFDEGCDLFVELVDNDYNSVNLLCEFGINMPSRNIEHMSELSGHCRALSFLVDSWTRNVENSVDHFSCVNPNEVYIQINRVLGAKQRYENRIDAPSLDGMFNECINEIRKVTTALQLCSPIKSGLIQNYINFYKRSQSDSKRAMEFLMSTADNLMYGKSNPLDFFWFQGAGHSVLVTDAKFDKDISQVEVSVWDSNDNPLNSVLLSQISYSGVGEVKAMVGAEGVQVSIFPNFSPYNFFTLHQTNCRCGICDNAISNTELKALHDNRYSNKNTMYDYLKWNFADSSC
ncbi:MAG: hypothetical protein ACMXYC_01680 [Candidatus Woesearchaeota archaeon]